jgi:hypothetical protein
MPGAILTAAGMVSCPHAAPGMLVASGARVLISGQPVALLSDMATIATCPLSSAPTPNPCVTVGWAQGSTRVLVSNQPLLLQDSVGLAKTAAQAPQGPALVVVAQTRVMGA